MDLEILFESADYVIVNKPCGIATEPDKSKAASLRDLVATNRKVAPHAVSRLDLGVSGAVLFAMSDRGKREAASLQQAGAHHRRYVAMVAAPISASSPALKSDIEQRAARTSLLFAATADRGVTMLVLAPETGRTHQLRIHCSRAGAPILGDPKYGGLRHLTSASGAVHALPRLFLHSYALGFAAELIGDRLPAWIFAPIPEPFRTLWARCAGHEEAWAQATSACSDQTQQ